VQQSAKLRSGEDSERHESGLRGKRKVERGRKVICDKSSSFQSVRCQDKSETTTQDLFDLVPRATKNGVGPRFKIGRAFRGSEIGRLGDDDSRDCEVGRSGVISRDDASVPVHWTLGQQCKLQEKLIKGMKYK
jgi:hypothetical protein